MCTMPAVVRNSMYRRIHTYLWCACAGTCYAHEPVHDCHCAHARAGMPPRIHCRHAAMCMRAFFLQTNMQNYNACKHMAAFLAMCRVRLRCLYCFLQTLRPMTNRCLRSKFGTHEPGCGAAECFGFRLLKMSTSRRILCKEGHMYFSRGYRKMSSCLKDTHSSTSMWSPPDMSEAGKTTKRTGTSKFRTKRWVLGPTV